MGTRKTAKTTKTTKKTAKSTSSSGKPQATRSEACNLQGSSSGVLSLEVFKTELYALIDKLPFDSQLIEHDRDDFVSAVEDVMSPLLRLSEVTGIPTSELDMDKVQTILNAAIEAANEV